MKAYAVERFRASGDAVRLWLAMAPRLERINDGRDEYATVGSVLLGPLLLADALAVAAELLVPGAGEQHLLHRDKIAARRPRRGAGAGARSAASCERDAGRFARSSF